MTCSAVGRRAAQSIPQLERLLLLLLGDQWRRPLSSSAQRVYRDGASLSPLAVLIHNPLLSHASRRPRPPYSPRRRIALA